MRFSNPGTIKTEEKETEEQQNTRNGRHRRTAAALVSDTIEKEKKKNACAVAPASPLVPKKMQRSPHRGGGARSSKRRARVSLWFSNSLRGFGGEAAAKSRRLFSTKEEAIELTGTFLETSFSFANTTVSRTNGVRK